MACGSSAVAARWAAVPGAGTGQRVQDGELGLALGYRVLEQGGCLTGPQGCQVGQAGVGEPLGHERRAHARVDQGGERVLLGCLASRAGGVPVQHPQCRDAVVRLCLVTVGRQVRAAGELGL